MPTTYTSNQINTGHYNINDIFGYVVLNPLPFRIIGFDETSTDGVYEAYRYCAETLQDAIDARRWCEGPVFGVYQTQDGGKSWNLVHEFVKAQVS